MNLKKSIMRILLLAMLSVNVFAEEVKEVKEEKNVTATTTEKEKFSGPTNTKLSEKENKEDLAKKLANPIAAMYIVPFQLNSDFRAVNGHKSKTALTIQPVIPVSISDDWNMISRTITSVVFGSDWGISDTTQSLFFSPKEPGPGGIIWGVGPAGSLPTGTNHKVGAQKWAFGPTFVALKQANGFTTGLLVNHLWGVGGKGNTEHGTNDQEVNATWLQPFITYSTKTATSIILNTETSYDWSNDRWSVPINLAIAQVLKVGDQLIQTEVGVRYWAVSDKDAGGPEGVALRAQLTLLFPRG